ncbi:MAG: acyl-CoA dehydrogenase family protein [Planctomycetota bacterium]|jgi:butyryl-CoA dehydrogenase|nr:acyl-CoA dehydrogenase family protein [Planctomycetota bacterium]
MLDYFLSEEQTVMVETAREIAEKKILPVRAQYDEEEKFPHEVFKAIAEADLTGVYIPEEFGGCAGGSPIMNMCLVTEELSKACGGISLSFASTALGALPILFAGDDDQKKRFLPRIAAGALGAFAITEAGAGSDAVSMRATAIKDGDGYVLNGSKMFITNGGEAELYSVIAMTDREKGARGASCFVLEKGMPGFSFGKKESKMGIRASATRELIFQDCRVPTANRLGREGSGFMTAMRTFDSSRPGVGSQALGIAAGALALAVDYARERKQFGKPVIANQGLQWMLADMATQVEAARALIYATARWIDAGAKRPTMASAMSKCFASDVAMKVTIDAIQIFGGVGYSKEYPIEKYARDAKITQIYEGTNQIQRDEIALALIKEAARK